MLNVFGWRNPVFKIYDSVNNVIEEIELPIVNKSGLLENISEMKVKHELNDFTLLQKTFGYRLKWTLPYDEYLNITTMLNIQEILRYQKIGYKIILTPRKDVKLRRFEVHYTGDSLEYGIHGKGSLSIGMKNVKIEFTTKYLIEDLGLVDPNTIMYAGFYLHNRMAVLAT